MKIAMVNYWSDSNKGDCAMALGTINAFKRLVPDVQFTIIPGFWRGDPRFPESCRHLTATYPELRVIPTILPLVDLQERTYGLPVAVDAIVRRSVWLAHLGTSLGRLVRPDHDEFFETLRDADLVVSSPGSYFLVIRPGLLAALERLGGGFYAFAYGLIAAYRMGRPYVLYAQSIGPFQNSRLLGNATRWLVDRAAYVTVRESLSKDELLRYGVRDDKVVVMPDASFGVEPSPPDSIRDLMRRHGLARGRFVAVTVRPWRQSGETAYVRYLETLAAVLDRLLDRGVIERVAIVIMCTFDGPDEFDTEAAAALVSRMRRKADASILSEDLPPQDISAVFGQAVFVIGTRAHSLNLSAIAGTPCIGISYWGYKTRGFMAALGLSGFVQDMQELNAETLLEVVDRLLERRDALAAEVRARADLLRKQTLDMPRAVLAAIGRDAH